MPIGTNVSALTKRRSAINPNGRFGSGYDPETGMMSLSGGGLQDTPLTLGNGDIAPSGMPTIDAGKVGKIYKPNLGGALERGVDRVGDFLQDDRGRAALLRSAGATLEGGLGAGIKAGADYYTGRQDADAKAEQNQAELAIRERQNDLTEIRDTQNYHTGLMGVTNQSDANRIRETESERNFRLGIRDGDIRIRQQDVGLQDNREQRGVIMRGQDIGLQDNREGRTTTERGQDLSYGASIYGDNMDYIRGGGRGAAGIGSKGGGYVERETKIPGRTEGGLLGIGGTDIPGYTEKTRIPMAPGMPGVVAPMAQPPAAAVAALKRDPSLKGEFERKFGPGSAAEYLGGR